jgi:hypothetical protein
VIDLADLQISSVLQRLKRARAFHDWQARQEIIAAEDWASGQGPRVRRAAPSREPAGSFVPASPAPRSMTAAPAHDRIEDDDPLRVRRAASAGGGAEVSLIGATGAVSRSVSVAAVASSVRVAAAPRSAAVVNAGLAAGSQAAVVKLASYGSGPARAGALLSYQSDKGQLALEREDGSFVVGKEAVAGLAAQWAAESSTRAPSNDSFAFTLKFDGRVSEDEAQAALAIALKGHEYAWRLEDGSGATRLHVVTVAASRERSESGKALRIYANAKSVDRLHDRLETAFGRDGDMIRQNWAHGVEGATAQLVHLTKAGEIEARTSKGSTVAAEAERLMERRAARRPGADRNPALELAKAWAPAMRSSASRDFAHIILSAKPGTDKDAFMDAARATLAREFGGHEYLFVMHTNRQHIHVHAAVRLTSPTGEKLHPGIQDFHRWRQTLAEEARERNIPMESTRRFDQAHAPAYKLKDAKMMEREIAPASVRRRVERVKNREIHRPTRPEGRKHAQDVARAWAATAERARAGALPPLARGAMRLYRAEPVKATGTGSHRAELFTTDRAIAEGFARSGSARLLYLDVPAGRIDELKPSRSNPDKIFVVPQGLRALSRPIDPIEPAAVLPFQRRADAALAAEQVHLSTEGKSNMRTVETMTTARKQMETSMEKISALLPDGPLKEDFERERRELLEMSAQAVDMQTRLEKRPGKIEGETYVEPKPEEVSSALFTNERKGQEVHYSRHDAATGERAALAFIDKGKELEIADWKNRETVLAALQVAAKKWETVSINGNAAYKETAAQLSVEHGVTITNPEMQDRIRQIQAERVAQQAERDAQRPTVSEGQPKTEDKNAPADAAAQPRKFTEAELAERARREALPEAIAIKKEIDGYTDDLAFSDDRGHKEVAARNLAAAQEKLETFLSGPISTPAERKIELESIRERVDQEADRETSQARRTAAAHEDNPASSSVVVPFRAEAEARTAREADRAVEETPSRPIPADPNQSPSVQTLRHEQEKVLNEEKQQQELTEHQRLAQRFLEQEARREQNKEESEGESM